jgi:uncharacterized membrane protein
VWHEVAELIHDGGLVIELMAVLVIAYASLETFVVLLRIIVTRVPLDRGRVQWLRFLNLLVVGLTFQLAADLVHITIAQGLEPLARVAIIAMLRTFLAYFLGRDLREWKESEDTHASAT